MNLNARGVENTFCGFQNSYPHAGREAKFVLDTEKCPDLNGKMPGFIFPGSFAGEVSPKTRKTNALNARGLKKHI